MANLQHNSERELDHNEPGEVAGQVALFAICLEQAWKTMKQILEAHGYDENKTGSPRAIIKLAFAAGMIDDESAWLQMLDDRNHANHTYDEERAEQIIARIGAQHLQALEKLDETLRSEQWRVEG